MPETKNTALVQTLEAIEKRYGAGATPNKEDLTRKVALQAIAQVQQAGGTAAFIDAEHALDVNYAAALGVDTDALLVAQPDNGEQALETTEALVRSGAVELIVIESVAALIPWAALESKMGDTHVGLHARLMSQVLRKLTDSIVRTGVCVLFINAVPDAAPSAQSEMQIADIADIENVADIARRAEAAWRWFALEARRLAVENGELKKELAEAEHELGFVRSAFAPKPAAPSAQWLAELATQADEDRILAAEADRLAAVLVRVGAMPVFGRLIAENRRLAAENDRLTRENAALKSGGG